jgi:methanogenic corrinoid protein MtbC1
MSLEQLSKLVEKGEVEESEAMARELLAGGTDPLEILDNMTQTMQRVGALFATLEIFLPEVMVAGDALTAVVDIVKPELKTLDRVLAKGKVVIGVVKGDLHEIGKNIVKLMLETNGFEVKDLGYDVDSLDFINDDHHHAGPAGDHRIFKRQRPARQIQGGDRRRPHVSNMGG